MNKYTYVSIQWNVWVQVEFTKENYRGLGSFFTRPRAVLLEPQSKVKVNEKLMVQGYTAWHHILRKYNASLAS